MNIYYIKNLEEYNNKDCYLLYFTGYGIFLNTPEDTFKIFEKEFYSNSITDINIDTYAKTRMFETVVKFRRPKHFLDKPIIEWFNDFDKDENKIKELISRLSRAIQIVYKKTIKRVPRDKMIHNIIGEISKFISSLS
jgi:hypothetical protein